jgi:hypothetical protein
MQNLIIQGVEHVVQKQHISNGENIYHVATYACAAPVHMVINMHYNDFANGGWYNVVYASIDGITYTFFSRMRYATFDEACKDFYMVVSKYDMMLCGVYPHILTRDTTLG